MRRKEEERKAKEAEQKRREEIARRLKELREKEASERAKRERIAKEKAEKEAAEQAKREQAAKEKAEKEAREKEQLEKEQREKEQQEKEARERVQRAERLREARERDLRERLERERALREKLEREMKEREAIRLKEEADKRAREEADKRAKEEAEKRAREAAAAASGVKEETTRKSTYAFSQVGERTNPWPNGKPSSRPASPATPARPSPTPTSAKRPTAPTARTYNETEEETYSFRPYDTPKRHSRRRSGETVFTQSSYAPSQSTARTSPPPSMRGAYSTKDPNKIVIKAVYSFMNQFAKTPASQLISGVGTVTDGLILRITTEGLFIDDDVRGVPQREWDVKAWTLKLMEVWCSSHSFAEPSATNAPKVQTKAARRADRGQPKTLTGDDADAFLIDMLRACKNECRLCPHGDGASSYADGQSGEVKPSGLHVLRATIRDQEGKRYLFILGEEEGWKVAAGLQRLRGVLKCASWVFRPCRRPSRGTPSTCLDGS
ncbi:uncharacterized protein BCR38DRAFT_422987, partial [Pseudomassariella vexata]